MSNADLAERRLRTFADSLECEHPGAANSLKEGLAETLILQRLGVRGALYQTLRSTNAIENLNGGVRHFSSKVKRWQGGAMLLRWVGAAVVHASLGFRRVRGYADLPVLVAALGRDLKRNSVDSPEKAA